jgi:hypothetical protein
VGVRPIAPQAAKSVDGAWNRHQPVDNASKRFRLVDDAFLASGWMIRLRAVLMQFDLGPQQPVGVTRPTDHGGESANFC